MNFVMMAFLRLFSILYNTIPALNNKLYNSDGPLNFVIGFSSSDNKICGALSFKNGRVKPISYLPEETDVVLESDNGVNFKEMLTGTPNELLNLILRNRLTIRGNISYLQLFNYYVSLLMGPVHQYMLDTRKKREERKYEEQYRLPPDKVPENLNMRRNNFLRAESVDSGLLFLDEPYLSRYNLKDFPRLQTMLDNHFKEMPKICPERTALLTQWFRREGFEKKNNGEFWNPLMRQALSFKYLMESRKPLIGDCDLLAGTSTSKLPTGVIIYPDAQGTLIWGELNTVSKRKLNPYIIDKKDAASLHDAFGFWAKRNFREWLRAENGNLLSQKIEERWVGYFVWKSVGISHTIPDFKSLLQKGTYGIIEDINKKKELLNPEETEKRITLLSMQIVLEAVNNYAANLARKAEEAVFATVDENRRRELKRLASICRRVPFKPARSLDEAVNSIWIMWIALHTENANTGLSLGRLDQLLQPYLANDMAKAKSAADKDLVIYNAIELVGNLFMRCTDHLPLVPDIGNYLFGGSSSDQAITLGGVTPEGKDAVNDMTYIILKVTEMLSIRDPNVNARFMPGINSDTYLKRLCEVNYVTAATPSMHNDEAVMGSLRQHNYPENHLRDWAAVGCVEATLAGRHIGHTGSILMNLVAALEMALYNGTHPLMKLAVGPKTGEVTDTGFATFESFFQAFAAQLRFLVDNAVELNNLLGSIHARYRPTPLLSSLIEGTTVKGLDVTAGGALYNSSGTANIGLADVTDSLLVIKKLVFEDKIISFRRLKQALERNFNGNDYLHTLITNKIALFGSGDEEALQMANRVASLVHQIYSEKENYRKGRYTSGFWSMSQHVAYGNLSGALPSGRKAGKPFTPGLTPQPLASGNYLDNIRHVAALDPENMDNNIAFNVKMVPASADSREKIVDTMAAYVKTYFQQGGMQIQFNVVKGDTLRDAMVNPENYPNLLVRISGYNAYFVTLNREMQKELIERAEFALGG